MKMVEVELAGVTIELLVLPYTVAAKDEAVWIDGCGKTADCWLTRTTLDPKGGLVEIAGVE